MTDPTKDTKTVKRVFETLEAALFFFAYATGATGTTISKTLIANLEALRSSDASQPQKAKFGFHPVKVLRLIRQSNAEGLRKMKSRSRIKAGWKAGKSPNGYVVAVMSDVAKTLTLVKFKAIPIGKDTIPCDVVLHHQTQRGAKTECWVEITGNTRGVDARIQCGEEQKVLG